MGGVDSLSLLERAETNSTAGCEMPPPPPTPCHCPLHPGGPTLPECLMAPDHVATPLSRAHEVTVAPGEGGGQRPGCDSTVLSRHTWPSSPQWHSRENAPAALRRPWTESWW